MGIVQALFSLRPGANWSLNGDTYEGLWWADTNELPPPTKEEVEAEVARLQAEYDAKEYQRLREPEYPDLKEFVDAYYWAQKGDDTKMNAYIVKCDAVKDKYPKSE
jgi:hypothetical protein